MNLWAQISGLALTLVAVILLDNASKVYQLWKEKQPQNWRKSLTSVSKALWYVAALAAAQMAENVTGLAIVSVVFVPLVLRELGSALYNIGILESKDLGAIIKQLTR